MLQGEEFREILLLFCVISHTTNILEHNQNYVGCRVISPKILCQLLPTVKQIKSRKVTITFVILTVHFTSTKTFFDKLQVVFSCVKKLVYNSVNKMIVSGITPLLNAKWIFQICREIV